MIRIYVPGFTSSAGGPRWGDCTVIDDGKNHVAIDGYCSEGKNMLKNRLKKRGVKSPYLYVSHAHGDHTDGVYEVIKDGYFTPKEFGCYDPETLSGGLSNSEIRSDYNSLKKIIAECNRRGIPVRYLKHGDHIAIGDISFDVYRDQPKYKGSGADPHGWEFVNDGSLCFWFPDISYLTTGDAGMWCAQRHNLHPGMIKGGHHGNTVEGDTSKPAQMAQWLYKNGCRYYWDNDYSTSNTSFLTTGRKRCIEAGMTFFNIHGDINAIAYGGKVVIYKGGKNYSYKCGYKGKANLKYATLGVVEDVLAKKYGNDEARVTNLLDAGYWPGNVQNHINKMLQLLKG